MEQPVYGSTVPPSRFSAYDTPYYGNMPPPPPSSAGYPTTTAVKTTRIVDVQPRFDPWYLALPRAILKIIELVCTFIAFVISVSTWSSRWTWILNDIDYDPPRRRPYYYPYAYGSAVWTDIVTSITFLVTLTLLLMYLFHFVEKYSNKAPWHLIEFLYCLAAGCLLLIAGAVMIRSDEHDPARGAVVFFCWAAMVAYSVEAAFAFFAWRADEPAQGAQ